MNPEKTKPAVGVIPKEIWDDKRMLQLAKGIYLGLSDGSSKKQIRGWLEELMPMVNKYAKKEI